MRYAADMSLEEREARLCRICKFRPRSELESLWCDECRAEKAVPVKLIAPARVPIANVKRVRKNTAGAITGAVILLFVVLALVGQCLPDRPTSTVEGLDKKAYEQLRSRGYSDNEARQAAPSVRRLCEQSGGKDCY